eukprot:TRINITY_DN2927_c5_g1::TRINITY_DN2927_c5_g1_i4::g.4642::m.4642 TRINITY_DN2927_c5_g1::TRINITY_DN2927_c5_g1_i4::g.4642  ORF type:complete len:412 (-),score=79.26,sp/Q2T9V2/IQCG_BOVIN/29.16/9e-27,IQ/PF00612.22/1.5e+04,IQ/PF00612.22/0.00026 TRINITY_DN2927_c5_g1_i4:1436-2632(-)
MAANEPRLSLLEAARVSSILVDALEKLSFLASITPDVLAHRDELQQMVGDEMSRIIQEQRKLEKRFEELINQRNQVKAMGNKSKYKEVQDEIRAVTEQLRHSTKVLCRHLKDNPNVAENLLKIQNERSALQQLLQTTVEELREGRFSTLAATVERERREQERLAETIQREKEASAAVKTLKTDLQNERKDHERDLMSRNEVITKLKEELKETKARTTMETKYMQKDARSRTSCAARGYTKVESEMEEDIRQLGKKLEIEHRVHAETEAFLKRKEAWLQQEIQKWNQKYDEDKATMERELEELKANRARDLVKLNEYTERYKQDMAEKEAREAEERRLAELAELKRQEEERQTRAAVLIQKIWRGYWTRVVQKRAKSKKGKKGKGKKGGKGAKGGKKKR